MPENNQRLNRLLERLNELQDKQDQFYNEMEEVRNEILRLQGEEPSESPRISEAADKPERTENENTPGSLTRKLQSEDRSSRFTFSWLKNRDSDDLESYIGENLISKIGIVVTIIGVAIGARYAIDNDLISPLMRVVLGYGLGIVLLFFALRLRTSMIRFSAVLFSGAMSIFYIITFAAYSFYNLLPAGLAFTGMVLITLLTVAVSIYLNMQPVAHIGLVGAYAVPFLVGGEGSISSFFIYMVIINMGILFTSVYKYWKPLTYSAFFFTWLIFGSWYWGDYSPESGFNAGISYSLVFFLIIYMAVLVYKLLREEVFVRSDIWLLLANSFIFYGFGFAIMNDADLAGAWSGIFTLGNSLIHAAAAIIIYRSGFSDRNLLYLIMGLAVTFLTLAIPVELDGSWVTLLWSAEAVLLFTIGRMNGVSFYEKMSHPVLALAFISLMIDWDSAYSLYRMESEQPGFLPLLNIHFFTSLFFISGLGWMVWKDVQSDSGTARLYSNPALGKLIRQLMSLLLIVAMYVSFKLEITGIFNQLYIDSKPGSGPASLAGYLSGNYDLLRFKSLWELNYTMFFIAGLIWFLADRVRSKDVALLLFAAVVICTGAFIFTGFEELGMLQMSYLDPEVNPEYASGVFHIGIRYICFAFLGGMLYMAGRLCSREYVLENLNVIFDALAGVTLLWILSNELMLWMDVADAGQPYRLGLSILWGMYALAVLALGIRLKKKHLRIGAILLLGVTLIKLFFYDLADLDAIARTIVFVTLGLLLLLASYLYNKFRKEGS